VRILNKDNQIEQSEQDVIVRFYSKIWTNLEENCLQGEGCTAVLVDGAQHNVADGLAFELHENFKCENILNRPNKNHANIH